MDIKKYFTEVKSEMNKVSWPSKRKAMKDSALVIGASIAMALFISGAATLFSYVTKYFLTK